MTREQYLARLASERELASQLGEAARVRELDQQIERESKGTPVNPAKETTAARRPARSKTA